MATNEHANTIIIANKLYYRTFDGFHDFTNRNDYI